MQKFQMINDHRRYFLQMLCAWNHSVVFHGRRLQNFNLFVWFFLVIQSSHAWNLIVYDNATKPQCSCSWPPPPFFYSCFSVAFLPTTTIFQREKFDLNTTFIHSPPKMQLISGHTSGLWSLTLFILCTGVIEYSGIANKCRFSCIDIIRCLRQLTLASKQVIYLFINLI